MFHYTTIKGLKGILSTKELWLVSALEMKDVSDRLYANFFAILALLISEDENAKLLRENLTPKDILDINTQTLTTPFYLASCCQENNEYLWKNYADNGKGACIEIDEKFFDYYNNDIVAKNYNPLDQPGNDSNNDYNRCAETILEKREIKYGFPMQHFNNVLNDAKNLSFDESIFDSKFRKMMCQNWLKNLLTLLSGTIKAERFSEEKEVRILFQNWFSKDMIKNNGINLLRQCELSNVIRYLGLENEDTTGKRKMKLNLTEAFHEGLIKKIILGDQTEIETIKELMRSAELKDTLLMDKEGNIL